MDGFTKTVRSPLFLGIRPEDMETMLNCLGHYVREYKKGEIIAFEAETINHVGLVLKGSVDMIKEDIWGNKTVLLRLRKDEMFGETFACGEDNRRKSGAGLRPRSAP